MIMGNARRNNSETQWMQSVECNAAQISNKVLILRALCIDLKAAMLVGITSKKCRNT
jgi:hypothetical protein